MKKFNLKKSGTMIAKFRFLCLMAVLCTSVQSWAVVHYINAVPTSVAPPVDVCTSTGITWIARTAAQANQWGSVAYGNGLFVAVAITGSNRVMTSPDGITWTARTAAAASNWYYVTFGNGLFVAVANSGSSLVMTSPDGINWTARTAAEANQWQSVTYGNGLFVAVAVTGTNRVMTSPDGITWTARAATGVTTRWNSVTFGNGLFVAVGTPINPSTTRVMTSPDGINWTARTEVGAAGWVCVTYGNGLFVAVTGGGVMTSPDGMTWTARTAAEGNSWIEVAYGNGLFVAVAFDGTNRVMTSPDGITWTARAAAAANGWVGVTFGNNIFVAVSFDGTNQVMTNTLQEINLQGGSPLTNILDGDIAPTAAKGTDFGSVIVSSNVAKTFTIQNTGGTTLNISNITSTNGLFVVSGLTLPATINASGSTTFTVTFSPTATGVQNATITLNNDDCDEAVYDFAVTGAGAPPDYSITTTGNAIVITDVSGNGETLDVSESSGNIRFVITPTTRTYSIDGGPTTAFTTPADVALAAKTSITINTEVGNDIINVAALGTNIPNLTINGGTGDDAVNFNGDITFAANANLDVDLQNDNATPGVDQVSLAANANLILSGTGAAVVKVSRNVLLNSSSSIETANGNLTVEANQQATPTSGLFNAVDIFGTLQASGSGAETVKGKGGITTSSNSHGISVQTNGKIQGGTSGAVTVVGQGGGGGNNCYGVLVDQSAQITSSGGAVSVTGTGRGTGGGIANYGVLLGDGVISNTGTGSGATVTVVGQGGNTSGTGRANIGVYLISSSQITSSGGAVSVTGTGGGAGASTENHGVYLFSGVITSTGSGATVTVVGQGGNTSANTNHGVYVNGSSSKITSSSGAVSVTGTGGGTSADILTQSGGMITSTSTTDGITLNSTTKGTWPNTSGTDVSTTATQKTTFGASSKLNIDIDGLTVNTQYQQLGVAGMIDLNGATLTFTGSTYTPVLGNTFTIVDNDGTDAVIGTFIGLTEGASITNFLGSGLRAQITYVGGSGNDVVLTVIAACPATGTIWYVNAAAAPGGNGASWGCAFQDLQSALAAASSGHEIWVATGTYKPTTTTDPSISFVMKDGVAIYGGFVGNETALNQRPTINPVSGIHSSTSLSGDIGTVNDANDNSFSVVKTTNLSTTAVLDGFVIRLGVGDGDLRSAGGGMDNKGGSPTIRNCSFQNNNAYAGGAIRNEDSSPQITNCSFQNNSATYSGGGVYNQGSSPQLFNCSFQNNSASVGGGVYNQFSNTQLINCSFQGNSASSGGGVYNLGSSPQLINCSFQGNSANSGGGVYNWAEAVNMNPSLTNCSFQGNSTAIHNISIREATNLNVQLTNCVFFGNGGGSTFFNDPRSFEPGTATITATYSLFDNTVTVYTGSNNLTTAINPFASTSSMALSICSPAIDAGTSTGAPTTDILGNARVDAIAGGSIVDMGAYEYQSILKEINLKGGSPLADILDGDIAPTMAKGTDFGNVNVSSNIAKTFTIQNTGGTTLNISSIASSNGLFTTSALSPASPIAAGGSATFIVTFSPTATGVQNATITVNNDDCNEAVYDFVVTADVTCATPTFSGCPTSAILKENNPNQCSAITTYSISASGSPSPVLTYTFSGATTKISTGGTGSGETFNKGTTSVVVTATNACGAPTCTFNVVVSDTSKPTATPPTDITINCGAALPTAATNYATYTGLEGTAGDNCTAPTSLTISSTDGPLAGNSCSGTILRSYSVTDESGNTRVVTQTITVSPATLPSMTALAPTTVACGSIPAPSTVSFSNGLSDGCLISGTSNLSTFSAAPDACGGTVVETWTATDNCGRTLASVSRNITVSPATLPTMTALAPTTVACGSIPAPSTISFSNGLSGACLINGASNLSTFSAAPDACGGTVVETWTATDNCGRTLASVSRNITVSPATLPTMTALAPTTVACGNIPAPSTIGFSNGLSDGCLISGNSNLSTFTASPDACGGTVVETWTAMDNCGRTLASVSRNITVSPATLPTMTALAPTTVACGSIPAPSMISFSNGLSDGCLISGTSNLSTFSATPDACGGTVVETWTATDNCGRTLASVSRNITVSPATLPTMTALAPTTVACGSIPAPSTISFSNGLSGACLINGASNLSTFSAAPDACGGTVVETWTATDNCGRALASVTRNITVTPATIPTMTAPGPITVACGSIPAASTIGYSNGLSGGCLISGTSNLSTFSSIPGTCGGTVIETWTAQNDACGRPINTVSRIITVIPPVQLPVISAPPNLTIYCENTLPMPSTRSFSNGLGGNCLISGTSNPSTFTTIVSGNCNGQVLETWTGSDNCGRILAAVSRTIFIKDTVKPVALCKNISLNLGNTGTITTNAAAVNNGSSDNCSNVALSLSKTSFNCTNFGANTVILTVTDNCSNSSTCTAIVTIGYNLAPVAKCKNAIVVLSIAGNGSISAAGVNNASTDLCNSNGLTLSLSKTTFNCSNVGSNVVTLTVTNVAGLSSTCTGTITIKDLTKPVAKCKAVSASVAPGGSVTVAASAVNNVSTDACTSPPNLILNPSTFTCANAGANTVVLTVSDASNNVSTCSAVVTITCNGSSAPEQAISSSALADYTELLDLFPNPAADKVNIRLSKAVNAATPVTIFDNTGRTMFSGWIAEGSTQLLVDLNLSRWTSGVYLVSVKLANQVQTKSLVIFRS